MPVVNFANIIPVVPAEPFMVEPPAAKIRASFSPLLVKIKTCPGNACGKVSPAPDVGTEVIFVTALKIFVEVGIVPLVVADAAAVVDQ